MFIHVLPDGKLSMVSANSVEELKEMFEKERADNIAQLEQAKAAALESSASIVLEGENDTVVNRKAKADAEFNAYKHQLMIDKLKEQTSFTSEKIFELDVKEINE